MSRSLAVQLRSILGPTRRRWTPGEARAVLSRLDASGLSVREFAEREGINRQRLYRLRRGRAGDPTPAFVEIARPAGGRAIELVLRSGHVVRVPDGFTADTLRQLVEVLDGGESRC